MNEALETIICLNLGTLFVLQILLIIFISHKMAKSLIKMSKGE